MTNEQTMSSAMQIAAPQVGIGFDRHANPHFVGYREYSSAQGNTESETQASSEAFMQNLSNLLRTEGTQLDKNMSYNRAEAELNRRFNAEQAQLNRDFQERMSSTSYQRAVKDLLNAGLNPILAFSHGGASTPTGASASSNSASMSSSGGVKASDLIYLLSVLASPVNSVLSGGGGSLLNFFSTLINLIPGL